MPTRLLLLFCLSVLSAPAFAIQDPMIIPTPRTVAKNVGVFSVTSQTRIVLGAGTTTSDRKLADIFNRHLEAHSRAGLSVVREQSLRKLIKGSLYIATPTSDAVDQTLRDHGPGLSIPQNPEGYLIDIRDERILLVSPTAQGRFYGMMTLVGLLHRAGRRLALPQLTIRDWPAQGHRGLRLITDEPLANITEILAQLIPLCGRVKLNTIEIVSTDHLTSDPEWGTTFDRLRKLSFDNHLDLALTSKQDRYTDSTAPTILLGFLPPGPEELALITAGATSSSELIPSVRFEAPSVFSTHWLGYIAAWTAENAWSSGAADLTRFSIAFFRAPRAMHAPEGEALRNFTLLQQAPFEVSLDELWIRPLPIYPCLHSQIRRHSAEILAAAAGASAEADPSVIGSGVFVRIGLIDFVATRTRAEALLASPEIPVSLQHDGIEQVVLSLDRLASRILEVSRFAPTNTQTGELIAALAFQRDLWIRMQAGLTHAGDITETLPPAPWMIAEQDTSSDVGDTLVLRRGFRLKEIPLEAHLVVSAFVPVQLHVNGSSVPVSSVLEQHSGSHPAVAVFDLAGLLAPGENLLDVLLPEVPGQPRLASAGLELGFRDGSSRSLGPDSLWRCSQLHLPGKPEIPAALWRPVRIVSRPECATPFPLSR